MKNVYIVTGNKYPSGDAGAVRQHAMAQILKEKGYRVTVLGYGESTNGAFKEYEGVKYRSFRPKNRNILIRALGRMLFGSRVVREIKKCHCADIILVIDILPTAFRKIEKYASKNHTLLVHDSVEWYSPEEYSNGTKNREYRLKEKTNVEIIDSQWRVIAISTYLENYFQQKCENVLRIPVIMDVKKIRPGTVEKTNNVVKFVYAGAPGKKDYLKDIVDGFALLPQEKLVKIELHIVGITKSQLINICGASENSVAKLGQSLILYGRVPREKALEILQNANYSVLLRNPVLRYAQAGFPTKVVESLAAGTPVLCNMSSDLELYLKDGINAVISSGFEPELFCEAIKKAIDIDFDQYAKMRLEARKTAEDCFDYRKYTEQFVDFLE